MNTMQNFDYSQYITNDKVVIENINLKNCTISGIPNGFFEIRNCNLENVVFDNHFSEAFVTLEESHFSKCHFHDTYEGKAIELYVLNNIFEDCLFENIKYCLSVCQSEVFDSKFKNCTFRNILIDGQISFLGSELFGGSITNFDYKWGEEIFDNQFTNMKMEQININGGLIENVMKNIIFDKVVVHTYDFAERIYKSNEYIECNTDGLTIIHHE